MSLVIGRLPAATLALLLASSLAACVADPLAPRSDLGGDDLLSSTVDLSSLDLVGSGADLSAASDLAADGSADLSGTDQTSASADLRANIDLIPAADLIVPIFGESNAGLNGGYFFDITTSVAGDNVYALSYQHVYATTDRGLSWRIVDPLPSSYDRQYFALDVRYDDDHALLIGTDDGRVFRSSDGGAHFDEIVGVGPMPHPPRTLIALAYVSDNLIFALSFDAIYRWNGTQWSEQTAAFGVLPSFTDVTVESSTASPRVYVATSNGIYSYAAMSDGWKSFNGAVVRGLSSRGAAAGFVWGFADLDGTTIFPVSPSPSVPCAEPETDWNPENLLLITTLQLVTNGPSVAYRDQACTGSWSYALVAPLRADDTPNVTVRGMTFSAKPPEVALLATTQGVLVSETLGDAGAWTDRSAGLHAVNVWHVTSDPAAQTHIYASTELGLFLSTDAGASWTKNTTLPRALGVLETHVSPSAGIVIVLTLDNRVLRTFNGVDWSDVSQQRVYSAIGIDPSNATKLFACTDQGVERSDNSGTLWNLKPTSGPGPASCVAMLLHPTSAGVLYAVDEVGIVWKSSDGGESFVQWTNGGGDFNRAWALDPSNDNRVLIARDNVLLDLVGGMPVVPGPTNPDGTFILAVARVPQSNEILLGTTLGLYRSGDGKTFARYSAGLPDVRANTVWVSSAAAQTTLVGMRDLGIWKKL